MAKTADPLSQLRDIHVPPPPAVEPVWDLYLAGLLALVAIALLLFALIRRKRHWRKEALEALSSIDTHEPTKARSELAGVLRRVAIQVSDQTVKDLSGENYLRQLDAVFNTSYFGDGPGRVFGNALYQPIQADTNWSAIQKELTQHIRRVKTG